MDPGALADRRPDGRAHPRRHRRRLALSAKRAAPPYIPRGAGHRAALLLGVCALRPAAASAAEPPAAATRADTAYAWRLPRGFPLPAVPADNPMSEAKVALGERLFFDPQLSATRGYACASCHEPARAFTDGKRLAVGATGEALPHNAPALVNVAYNISFGWDKPQVRSLEAQMLSPLLNEHPIELGLRGHERSLAATLAADSSYARAFALSFPGAAEPVSFDHVVKAIAAFERTLISGDSPFDRYVFAGEHTALSAQAKAGMALFYSARVGCSGCHSGFNFSGNWRDASGATGRASFARNGTSDSPMKVPTLRNVTLTAPYMHDGRFASLEAVLEHYSGLARLAGGAARIDPRLPRTSLSEEQRAALLAFLESLTDAQFAARFARAP